MLRQETAKNLVQKYLERLPIKVDEAILFGSTATNTRLAESDIDLIIISEDFKEMALPQRFLILQKNWESKTDLEAFGFTREEFDSLKNKSIIVQEATENGIKLKTKKAKNITTVESV
jgi:predicted nucleotidyltransferase